MGIIPQQYQEVYSTLFSLAQTLQHLLPYPTCLIGVQPKCKSNNHFKTVICCPTCGSSKITPLGGRRAKHSTLVYRFYGSLECRGYYPEQLHQFHFRHPNIVAWDIYSATFTDCYNCSFHSYIAIEISLND